MISEFSILNRAKYFFSGIFQNWLVFIPAQKYIKYFNSTSPIDTWKCNDISEENIENIIKSNKHFAPSLVDRLVIPDMNFNGHFFNK